MTAPSTLAAVQALSNEFNNFTAMYTSMIASATAFVSAYTVLAADSSNSVISGAYRTWASTLAGQVGSFLASTTVPPPP